MRKQKCCEKNIFKKLTFSFIPCFLGRIPPWSPVTFMQVLCCTQYDHTFPCFVLILLKVPGFVLSPHQMSWEQTEKAGDFQKVSALETSSRRVSPTGKQKEGLLREATFTHGTILGHLWSGSSLVLGLLLQPQFLHLQGK